MHSPPKFPRFRRFALFLLFLCTGALAGCGDGVTEPLVPEDDRVTLGGEEVSGPNLDATICIPDYNLCGTDPDPDPVCDPWADLNWCDDGGDPCMESTQPGEVSTQGCSGGGGGGGGGGGPGDGGGSDPGDDLVCPQSTHGGCEEEEEDKFDCHSGGEQCDLREPTSEERQKVQDAVDQIKEEPEVCAEIKISAQQMIDDHLSVWDNEVNPDPENPDAVLLADFVTMNMPDGSKALGLHIWTQSIDSQTVAHEAMHRLDATYQMEFGHYPQTTEGKTMAEWEEACT